MLYFECSYLRYFKSFNTFLCTFQSLRDACIVAFVTCLNLVFRGCIVGFTMSMYSLFQFAKIQLFFELSTFCAQLCKDPPPRPIPPLPRKGLGWVFLLVFAKGCPMSLGGSGVAARQ